ncbi:MAG: FG-GAP-like repeat-containing protein [Betaproteobacteria bacterium]
MNARAVVHVTITCIRVTALAMALSIAAPAAAYDWLQFNGDAAHSGVNTLERRLGPANVESLAFKYAVTLPATADGAPVALRGVQLPGGPTDMLFVTTLNGDLVALNAATGVQLWSKPHGPGTCKINKTGGPCYTTSSPAIDPSRAFVYGYGLDGYVHKHQVTDGTEITTGGWPQLATLKPFHEKGSSALSFAVADSGTYLYAVHGGYPGDNGDYQGHVTTINLVSGAQTVFNTMCSNVRAHFGEVPADPNPPPTDPYCTTPRSAIWSRPGTIYDEVTDRLFLATGNGVYSGNTDGLNWSESVLAIHADGTSIAVRPVDAYTPANFQSLDSADADVGSTLVAIIPVPSGASVAHLGVQGGKDSKLRLVNLDNLANLGTAPESGHLGGAIGSIINVPQGGGVFSQPVVWINPVDGKRWVFVATSGGLSGLQLQLDVSGNPSLVPNWTIPQGGTSPVIARNVLYYAGNGTLRAVDPTSGNILWSSAGGQVGGIHWQSPIAFNGALYVTDQSAHMVAFTPTGGPAAYGFDLDADRMSDLAWRDSAGQTQLWKMNGVVSSFTKIVMTDANWSLTGAADFNGDGKSDLVWKNANSGATALWLMDGIGVTGSSIAWPDGNWTPVHFGDFNGDGFADIVWRNATTGATAIWLMNGLASRGSSVVFTDSHWVVAASADFDGDGKDDLLWTNAFTGETAIWLMDGLQSHGVGIVMSAPWSLITIGDFDGDGKADLVLRNATTGETMIALMDGVQVAAAKVIFNVPNWVVTHAADFNNDGRYDLVWRNTTTGTTAIWLMDGFTTLESRIIYYDANWTVTQVGDVDHDGKGDIFWRHQDGSTAVWTMNGTTAVDPRFLHFSDTLNLISPLH